MGRLSPRPDTRWDYSGERFRIEVLPGTDELKLARMKFRHFTRPPKETQYRGQPGEYYSVDGYPLRDGLRAAIGADG
jgi:hypothetical protein